MMAIPQELAIDVSPRASYNDVMLQAGLMLAFI